MSEKRKLLGNSLSMLLNRLTQGIATFVLTAAMARNLGAYALGQYLLAVSYYYIFVQLASQGFKTLFTREIARYPELTPVYLVNGTLLQFVFSIIAYVGLFFVILLLPYSDDTSSICYIVGLTIIPFALSNITEAIFQAQEKMHLIAVSTVPIYIMRLLAMIGVMQLKYGIKYIAIILVISESIILLIEWLLLLRIVRPKWQIRKDFIWDTIKSARTFIAIEGVGIIGGKIDILILSLLGSEFLIGIYGAITQLMQPFTLIASSVTLAAFPGISKAVYSGIEAQRKVIENLIEILLCMGLPFLIGLLFWGQELLLLIYKNPSFAQASSVLNIISLSVITFSFSRSFSYLLIANGYEKFNLIEVMLTTILGGFSGIWLIAQYKLLGAAFMALLMNISSVTIFVYAVYSRIFKLNLWRIIKRPLIISILMLFVFMSLNSSNLDFRLTLILATSAYCLIACFLMLRSLGGFSYVWQKFFNQG